MNIKKMCHPRRPERANPTDKARTNVKMMAERAEARGPMMTGICARPVGEGYMSSRKECKRSAVP